MRLAILGSGSTGNAAVVECGDLRLLVDAGLSAKQLVLRLNQVGVDPESLGGILLTHEHSDHTRGMKVFLKQWPLPVFATEATSRVVRETNLDGAKWKIFEAGRAFAICDVMVDSFATQHDAIDPVGFVIRHESKRLGLLSDTGFITHSVTDHLRNLDALFVEANYDKDLLEADTKRPWPTKQRISSRHGHLSNEQVAELLEKIAHPALGRIVLGHLSSDCNTPDLALKSLRTCLTNLGHPHTEVHCASQHEPSAWFII